MTNMSQFYNRRRESDRLLSGVGQLESTRTRELLAAVLPGAPATVFDIGGGTGHYAGWLQGLGYNVHFGDIVPEHVARAVADFPEFRSAVVADARNLPWADGGADAILLMGPLYHLTERADRIRALREAARIARHNAVIFAVVIPRWASALVGMLRNSMNDQGFAEMVGEELSTGRHSPPIGADLFMDGFFHSQADIRNELADGGLELIKSVAIEGPAWMWDDFETAWADVHTRSRILEIARHAESDPDVIGTSPHVGIVCRKM